MGVPVRGGISPMSPTSNMQLLHGLGELVLRKYLLRFGPSKVDGNN